MDRTAVQDGITRRDALRAAGVGAAGAGVAALAGTLGTGLASADPGVRTAATPDSATTWDPECDALMKSVLERGDVERTNRALAQWETNSQPLPAGLPSDVRDFIEEARKLPEWLHPRLMKGADKFYTTRSFYLSTIIGLCGGIMMSVIPRESRAVYWSAGGADMKDRIAKTYRLVYDQIAVGAYGPSGRAATTAVKVRLTHGAVRHLLPQSPHWKKVADQPKPISQADMMVTWHTLATMGMRIMRNWGVRLPQDEVDGLLHSWQVNGHMLGIRDEYIPSSWDQAERQAQKDLDTIMGPTPEGVKIANMLVDLGRDLDARIVSRPAIEAFTRYSLGDKLTDWMQLPPQPLYQGLLTVAWPTYVAIREGGLTQAALPPELYHQMDQIANTFELVYLGGFRPINIAIPTGNNPNYSKPKYR
ncbi:oxygenase MpaB family protein [Tsukamurella sp. DT100]|uniref:oxygenase MpaB family protein n=1 Tax=Tsukamurella sp. DT100 TaxID=3393415 RepID=UPI003CE7BD14